MVCAGYHMLCALTILNMTIEHLWILAREQRDLGTSVSQMCAYRKGIVLK